MDGEKHERRGVETLRRCSKVGVMDDVGCRVARLVMQHEAAVSVASKHGNDQSHLFCGIFFEV